MEEGNGDRLEQIEDAMKEVTTNHHQTLGNFHLISLNTTCNRHCCPHLTHEETDSKHICPLWRKQIQRGIAVCPSQVARKSQRRDENHWKRVVFAQPLLFRSKCSHGSVLSDIFYHDVLTTYKTNTEILQSNTFTYYVLHALIHLILFYFLTCRL